MVGHMLISEGSHEVVTVVVVGLHAEIDTAVVTRFLGGCDEVLRKKLTLLVEVVSSTLKWSARSIELFVRQTHDINQKIQRTFPLLDQLRSIVGFPLLLLILSEVSRECFLAPLAVDGVGNRGEGGARLILAGVLEELFMRYPGQRHPIWQIQSQ